MRGLTGLKGAPNKQIRALQVVKKEPRTENGEALHRVWREGICGCEVSQTSDVFSKPIPTPAPTPAPAPAPSPAPAPAIRKEQFLGHG